MTGTNWFLERVVADQVLRERNDLQGEIKHVKLMLTAIRLLVEGGNPEGAAKLIKSLEDSLAHN